MCSDVEKTHTLTKAPTAPWNRERETMLWVLTLIKKHKWIDSREFIELN